MKYSTCEVLYQLSVDNWYSTVFLKVAQIEQLIAPMTIYCMNLQCVLYMLVKTRSFCRSSFECSKRSKSTYFTQFTNIAYIQRLIPPQSRGVSPHIYIFYESALLLLHASENQKSVSFVIRVQQRIKVDLLHTVCKHCLHSKDHTSTLKRGVTTYLHIL